MYHWDMILLLMGGIVCTGICLALAIKRSRWHPAKVVALATAMGTLTEIGAYSLKSCGSVHSSWFLVWVFFHLPVGQALDPLHLPLETWKWVVIVLNSVLATGLWCLGYVMLQEMRSRKPCK